MENEAWKEEYRKRAEERVRAVEAAQARIDALIARAGSPVMIVKNNEQYSASARMAEIDKRARMMAHQLNSPKYECTISIMSDEIIAQDAKLRDMANIIDRMEAALHNTLNERDQLKRDLHYAVTYDWVLRPCHFCAHLEEPSNATPCETCLHHKGKPGFEWRGVPDKEEESDEH